MTPDVPSRPLPDAILWPALASLLVTPAAQILTVALSRAEVVALPRHIRAPDATWRSARLSRLRRTELRGPQAASLILSPLVRAGFDAMDLLTTLREEGYAGRYLVLSPQRPDIARIRGEMQALSGGLNVDIFALGGGPTIHLV